MKISNTWLKEFIDITASPAEIAETLNMLGIEVESYIDTAAQYQNFLVGSVERCEKHPKADKLSVCDVFDGTNHYTVVCGAPNVAQGQKVIFAKPGAIVPNGGFQIGVRSLRGIESQGMICSQTELNIGNDGSGIWVLGEHLELGTSLADVLGANDVIYEISITPNRADALSHRGIARALSVYYDIPLNNHNPIVIESSVLNYVTLELRDDACPRYMARVLKNVTVKESPSWLARRLEAVGIRPRNAVVDVTNYVLMECGHPLHAFDAQKINGSTIIVQKANAGDSFVTLDGKQRALSDTTLMICDSEKNLAVAGVMGGEYSAITMDTTDVLLESAMFSPSSIRKTARQLGINSDASYRYERGTDIDILEYAVNRAATLIQEICGGEILNGIIESYPNPIPKKTVHLRYQRVRSILGHNVSNEKILDLMRRLMFQVDSNDDESCTLSIPHFRIDVHTEIDVIEEIAINLHYDSIPVQTYSRVPFDREPLPKQYSEHTNEQRVKQLLRNSGFNEVVTQNQIDPSRTSNDESTVRLANPLGQELSVMRDSLVPSMLQTVSYNFRNGAESLRLFEVGNTFRVNRNSHDGLFDASSVQQTQMLCICMAGEMQSKQWYSQPRSADIFDVVGVVENLLATIAQNVQVVSPIDVESDNQRQTLRIAHNEKTIGQITVVSEHVAKMYDIEKTVILAELSLDLLNDVHNNQRKYAPISKFPAVQRDISLIINTDIPVAKVLATISSSTIDILTGQRVFDVYSGKPIEDGKKSVSVALYFQSKERTLTDSEVDAAVRVILDALTNQYNAYLRV